MERIELLKQQFSNWFDLLDFEPKFYILDHGLCRIMLVKKEDKYEYKGVFMENIRTNVGGFYVGKKDVYPACVGKQRLHEYRTNYDFTKNKDEAFEFLKECENRFPITTEQMQCANQDESYHY